MDGTEVYGCSDDYVTFNGDIHGQVDSDDVVVFVDDGTRFQIRYNEEGIWKISILSKGTLFDGVDICDDPEAARYSDTLRLKPGAKRAWAAKECELVR